MHLSLKSLSQSYFIIMGNGQSLELRHRMTSVFFCACSQQARASLSACHLEASALESIIGQKRERRDPCVTRVIGDRGNFGRGSRPRLSKTISVVAPRHHDLPC
jgi:hypothetical protein